VDKQLGGFSVDDGKGIVSRTRTKGCREPRGPPWVAHKRRRIKAKIMFHISCLRGEDGCNRHPADLYISRGPKCELPENGRLIVKAVHCVFISVLFLRRL